MGREPPLPVRMGAKHSVTLRMGSEPPLPVRMGAKHYFSEARLLYTY
jgi:hypothetical protein